MPTNTVSVRVVGTEALVKNIELIRTRVLEDVQQLTSEYAKKTREEARKRAPYDTGNLYHSIKYRTIKDQYTKKATTFQVYVDEDKAPYGKYVEYGTQYAPARPFLTPAFRRYSKEYKSKLQAIVKRRCG